MSTATAQPETHIVICGGYTHREETHHMELKWCFNCRARHLHTWTVLFDDIPSYYGPTGFWACAKCGHDHTGFPGTEWWYGE